MTDEERQTYEWQMWTEGFGERGQESLKSASVLVSRVGGVGSAVAYYLAAAGIGRLVLAHGGAIRHSDLNRQILMTHAALGTSRVQSATKRLQELNPRLRVDAVEENMSSANAEKLIAKVDLVVDCAPLFEERYAMNSAAVKLRKPLVECAMYEMEVHVTAILPGKTPCLSCLYPQTPTAWKRQFPVFGAVAGVAGTLGATEAIKILSGLGKPLYGRLLTMDLNDMSSRVLQMKRNPDCAVCGGAGATEPHPGPPR
jgi:molybdopterin-synthase adenylyltransferase